MKKIALCLLTLQFVSSSIYKYLNCSLKDKGDGSFESPYNAIPILEFDQEIDQNEDLQEMIFEILDGP